MKVKSIREDVVTVDEEDPIEVPDPAERATGERGGPWIGWMQFANGHHVIVVYGGTPKRPKNETGR